MSIRCFMNKKMCIFIAFLCTYLRVSSPADQSITFTLQPGNIKQVQLLQYTLRNTNTTVCSVVLKNSTLISQSVVLMAKITPNSPQISRSAYSRLKATDYTDRDLENANKGKDQIVQIRGLQPSQTIYIFLVIFDIVYQNYTVIIEITETTSNTNYCISSLGVANPNKPYCSSCLSSVNYGAYCQNNEFHLSDKAYLTTINSKVFKSFVITQQNASINIQVKSNLGKVQLFIQFKNNPWQIAGLINYYQINSQKNRFILSQGTKFNIKINSSATDISLGVLNDNPSPIQLKISYSIIRQRQQSPFLFIIFVAAGILVVGLLIGAFMLIKKKIMQSRLHNLNPIQPLMQNQLSNDQIQIYFPSVSLQTKNVNQSFINFDQTKRHFWIESDCVICLSPIQNSSIIKVTYCRHIFHSQCLIEWFKKLKNCPYCRKQFTKSITIQDYQHVVESFGKIILKGQELIQQILKTNYNKSKLRQQIHD